MTVFCWGQSGSLILNRSMEPKRGSTPRKVQNGESHAKHSRPASRQLFSALEFRIRNLSGSSAAGGRIGRFAQPSEGVCALLVHARTPHESRVRPTTSQEALKATLR